MRENTRMAFDIDEIEVHSFSGRTDAGRVYSVGDKWVFADGDRDSAQAFATLLEPDGEQGWTVMLEKRSREEGHSWEPSVVGNGMGLTYAEAEQVAYIFHTEGEVDFEFHSGIALSISGGVEFEQIVAKLSERYDERRYVYFQKEESGWYATGGVEIWDTAVKCFFSKHVGVRFPKEGHGDLETVRALAYEWVIQPALADSDRASAWWMRRCTREVLLSKVAYLYRFKAA